MSLIDLAPANTKRTRENASRTFLNFLKNEEVGWGYLETCTKHDNAALVVEAVVDKFGIYLAFKEGRKYNGPGVSVISVHYKMRGSAERAAE
jgi:hypothetical protein